MNANQTPHGQDVERDLGALLHDRLDAIRSSVDLTGPVIARSRRIQRNRTVAGVAAVTVAALAVAGPLAWAALRGGSDHAIAPATRAFSTGAPTSAASTTEPSTTPTATGVTTATSQTSATTASSLPTLTIPDTADTRVSANTAWTAGRAGDAVWSVGKVVHRGDGSSTLSVGSDWEYVPLAGGNGLAIEGAFEKERSVSLIGPDGAVLRRLATLPGTHSSLSTAASGDGATVALYAANPADDKRNDALIYAWDAQGRELAHKGNLVHTAHLAGWHDGRVFLGNVSSGHSYTWDLGTNVIDNYYDGGSFGTVSAQGLAAAFTPIGQGFTGCTVIVDVRGVAPRPLSTHCGDFQAHGPAGFSPDGRYLVGSNAYQDGFGPGLIRVLDTRTGRVALEVTDAAFLDHGFAADGSLLLDVLKGYGTNAATQVIGRCTVDGTCTRITDEVRAPDELDRPMRLHLLSAR